MNKYEQILDLCVGGTDCNTWMRSPFIFEDKAISTDGSILPIIDKSLVGSYTVALPHIIEIAYSIIFSERNKSARISLDPIRAVIPSLVIKKEYPEKEKKCGACLGSGEIEAECPVCEGFGVLNVGDLFNVPSYPTLKIGSSYFSGKLFQRVLKIAELLDTSEMTLIHQTDQNKFSLFAIGDIEVCVMPVFWNDTDTGSHFPIIKVDFAEDKQE